MINKFYLQKEIKNALKNEFKKNKELPSVAIGNFLSDIKKVKVLYAKGWKEEYSPDVHRHEVNKKKIKLDAFIKEITGKNPLKISSMRFKHRSYTILHDKEKQKQGVLAFLFIDDWKEEYGGQIVFVKNGRTLASFTPRENTLLIVERKKGVKYFVKYVNHRAGKNALRIISP